MGVYTRNNIITNGLVLCLDAANKMSYAGSGTSWNDLSGNNNTGTLTNGPTFSNNDGGRIVFDGTNDFISGSMVSSLFTTDVTAEAWVKINSFSGDWVRIIGTGGNAGSNRTFGLWYDAGGTVLWQRFGGVDPVVYPPTPKLTNTSWYHIVATTNGSAHALYLNGNIIGAKTAAGPWPASNEIITLGYAGFHTYINGSIAAARLYTRGLSTAEVLQNYNATKTRFGMN